MSTRVGLTTDAKSVDMVAGGVGVVQITVVNMGRVVDAFDLQLRGLDSSWYTLTPERVSLFPGAKAAAVLQLRAPAASLANAGTYTAEVIATSRDAPTESTSVAVQVVIAAQSELSVAIEPQRIVARRATFTSTVSNDGNVAREVVLRPTDAEEMLLFSFGAARLARLNDRARAGGSAAAPQANVSVGRPVGESVPSAATSVTTQWSAPSTEASQGYLTLTVPPASRVDLPLSVQTRHRIWTGRDKPFKFEVAATPPGVEWEASEARKASAELLYHPIFAWWSAMPLLMRRVVGVLLPLVILGLLLYLLLRPQNQPKIGANTLNVGATQTALASAASASQTAAALALAGSASGTQTALALLSSAGATQTAIASANTGGAPGTGLAGPLRIVRFDFGTGADGGVQVSWNVTNALTVTLNNKTVPISGTQAVDTTSDQALVLSATNGKDVVTRSGGIVLMRPPEIKSFVAEPAETCPGCEVTLRWNTVRSEQIMVDGTPVPNQATAGSMKVKPSDTTEYLLTAKSGLGQVESSVTVNVKPGLPTPSPAAP